MKEKNHFLSRGCSKCPNIYNFNNKIFKHGCNKLDATDWLKDIKGSPVRETFDCVEVRFKNNRKEFLKSPSDLKLEEGDMIAVESSPGHDIGVVTLTDEVARLQMKKKKISPQSAEIKKVYRKTRASDIEKWASAVELEESTMFEARKIAKKLNLDMKINDVEYQGDKTKAIFYYTAEDRVDFRELIKSLAEKFMIRIEMRQIGVRQESSKLGGIGSCGRELCCSTWLNDFKSVSTNAARNQQLSINPQKLAGQCSKLKCCLNYENDCYTDALKGFPSEKTILKTKKGDFSVVKLDVHKEMLWFTTKGDSTFHPISAENTQNIINLNKKGIIPESIDSYYEQENQAPDYDFESDAGEGDLNRFNKKSNKNKNRNNKNKKRTKK